MLCISGRIALSSFSLSLSSLVLLLVIRVVFSSGHNIVKDWYLLIVVIHAILSHCFLGIRYYNRNKLYFHVSQRACLLGYGLTLGLLLSILGTTDWSSTFGLYLSILSLFHFSEYIITSIINPRSLSLDSFLLNHSKEYGLAALLAVIEFTLESYFWPKMKSFSSIKTLGLILCISGETIRKLAMITAGSNFNHVVQSRREDGHVLVTHGVYSFCRHPSYVGWFFWSIGTQLILLNPICCIGYAIAGWKFFNERIYEEEITLLNFFGEDYLNYKQRVRSGLPFIYGYRFEE